MTSSALERMGVPYKIVVEPQEANAYRQVIDPAKILVLPFKNLGKGGIPARNWVWRHSLKTGAKRHWILDDNISYFLRRDNGAKIRCRSMNIFRACEDLVDRYSNVGMAGFNYQQFVISMQYVPQVTLNTRIYSCILIDNRLAKQVSHRDQLWRGKFNEDTDLSLRFLKKGLCTILFNAFLIKKGATMKMQGGNTEEVYDKGKARKEFAISLQKQHPDIVDVVHRFGRWHHYVNYRAFSANKLIERKTKERVSCGKIEHGINNYSMKLKKISSAAHTQETKKVTFSP